MGRNPVVQGRVLVVCDDLFFWAKIEGTARLMGVPVERVRDETAMEAALASGDVRRVLADLGSRAVDPLAWAPRWKQLLSPPELVGFVSHVDEATQQRARAAGFDQVLPNSRFSRTLGDWLR
jgi:CheY-like chemotaxis protein